MVQVAVAKATVVVEVGLVRVHFDDVGVVLHRLLVLMLHLVGQGPVGIGVLVARGQFDGLAVQPNGLGQVAVGLGLLGLFVELPAGLLGIGPKSAGEEEAAQ